MPPYRSPFALNNLHEIKMSEGTSHAQVVFLLKGIQISIAADISN
jgi:hypothetical protein